MNEIIKRCCHECECETPGDVRACPVKVYSKMLRENPTLEQFEAWAYGNFANVWDGEPVSFLGIP